MTSTVLGAELTGGPENYLVILKRLAPGDTLILTPGEYKNGLPIHYLNGLPGNNISIRGPKGSARAVLVASSNRNTISIIDSSYVLISNLYLDGRNVPVDGVKAEGHAQWAHHITLEDLVIQGHGHDQQTVGISTKCPAWAWEVRRNVIKGAGTGMYFGNSDGSAPFFGATIEHNLIVDTIGYNLQIKHQQARPAVAGMPRQPNATMIRHNVFSKAVGGSKEMARPNVLVGHWPLTGPGAQDQYLIYGNFFYQNPHESLFQGEGNIALHNNLFVNHVGDAVRIQPHHDTPRAVDVFSNTVVATGVGIHLARRESDAVYPQSILGNIVFAGNPGSLDAGNSNVAKNYSAAARYLVKPFAALSELNLRVQPRTTLPTFPKRSELHKYLEWNHDFDGRLSHGNFGAYVAGNFPGWTLQLEIKPTLSAH